MDTQTVPVQAIVALFGILLTIISGLILWVLTKLATETKDTKVAITALEDKMNTELDKKPGSVEMNLRFDGVDLKFEAVDRRFNSVDQRFDGVEATLKRIEGKLDLVQSMQVSMLEDLAFIKGREEARRELASK